MTITKKSFKSTPFFAVLILVIIALSSGLILSVLSDVLYVSDEEKTNRDLAKVYTSDSFTAIEIDSSAISAEGNILYLYQAADGAVVIKASGIKGWKGVTEIVLAVKDGEIVNAIISSHNGDDKTSSIKASHLQQMFVGQKLDGNLEFTTTGTVGGGTLITAAPSCYATWPAVISAANVAVDYLQTKNLTGGAN
ncbi:MAG: hypothetical protein IKA42_02570 [Clostridia bacterium]|nr:hypothetical protein [Clostridia bacterium]